MATVRPSHADREQIVLTDLEASFPQFAGLMAWTKVPDGQDPPDFIGHWPTGRTGLEMCEWLDGSQMGPAKGRDAQRCHIRSALAENWQAEYQPNHFSSAVVVPKWGVGIAAADQTRLRQEFFACAAYVDSTWISNPERRPGHYYQADFGAYPLLERYITAIRYIEGKPHGFCWIDVEEDGGAYDPYAVVRTLEQALDSKLTDYSSPAKQAHLTAHGLKELHLLMHGGLNACRYNTPAAPLSLERIAHQGANFYARHPQRQTFNRVWFFDSLDSADDVNQLLGYPHGYGRVRWLAQLWPEFNVYPGSVPKQ